MITKEVRNWIQKVKSNQYSYDDAMYELKRLSGFLTKEEIKQIKEILYKT